MFAAEELQDRLKDAFHGAACRFPVLYGGLPLSSQGWLKRHFETAINDDRYFPGVADKIKALQDPEQVRQAYDRLAEDIFSFYDAHDFTLARCALEMVIDLKRQKGELRQDGVSPGYAHELRQCMASISKYRAGLLPKNHPDIGSMEFLFCAHAVHDIGEDFGMLGDEFCRELRKRYTEKPGRFLNEKEYSNLRRVVRSMELLTFDREFEPGKVEEITGISLDKEQLQKIEKYKPVRFPELEEYFRERMERSGCDLRKLRVFAKVKERRVVFVVTRHGMTGGDRNFDQNPDVGIDWNSYIRDMMTDAYVFLAKMIDRNEGLSTRIGMKEEPLKYFNYLDRTSSLFQWNTAAKTMKDGYKPLRKAYHAADCMMGILFAIGHIYADNHPHNHQKGEKGSCGWNILPVDFKHYVLPALQAYRHMPKFAHPIVNILRQFRTDCISDIEDLEKYRDIMQEDKNKFFSSQEEKAEALSEFPPRISAWKGMLHVLGVIQDSLIAHERWWNAKGLLDPRQDLPNAAGTDTMPECETG